MKPLARVLITGGSGFIGSHLAEALLSDGYSVAVLDNHSTGSPRNIAHLQGRSQFTLARADIRDEIVLDRLLSEADIVFHLAAAVGVKLIVEQPVHTIETNIMGTEAVLKGALRYGCRVLIASTSEVYGKGSKMPLAEQDDVVLGPTDKCRWAYAASKMVDEFLALAYHQQHGLPATVFRLFNTVGPRQVGQYGMVVPRFVTAALRDEPIVVYGDGKQSRCFCHVSDVVAALRGLALHPEVAGKVFNIGSTQETSILNLAQRVRDLLGSRSQIVRIPYAEAYAPGFEDMARRVPDATRIQTLLGWRPKVSLDEMISSVADHLRQEMQPRMVAA